MYFKSITAALAGAVLFSAASASAGTITQDRLIGGDPDDLFVIADFDQYDGPGTLLSATLDWTVAAGGTVSAYACGFFHDCEPGKFTLSLLGITDLAGPDDDDSDYSGIDNSTNVPQYGSVYTEISDSFAYGDLGDFVGSGLVAGIEIDGIYEGYPHALDDGFREGLVTLTYEYATQTSNSNSTSHPNTNPTTVPEPGALAIFGLGLAGLGFARRKKAS